MEGPHLAQEYILKIIHLLQSQILQKPLGSAIQNRHLLSHRHRRILRLDQKPVVLSSLVQGHERDRIHIAAELREGFQLTILCLVDLQGSGNLLHTLYLCASTHT